MNQLPRWDLHRSPPSAAAPPVTDPTDINNLVLFPQIPVAPDVDIEASGFDSVLVYWFGTGTALETDTITFEPLFWDGTNGRWTRQPRFTIGPQIVGEMPSFQATRIRLRIHAVALNAAVRDVRIYSTGGAPSPRRGVGS